MSEVDPRVPIYDPNLVRWWWPWLARIGTLSAVGGTAVTVWLQLSPPGERTQPVLLGLAALWAIGAPLWFFLEFHYFYRTAPGPKSWDLFKHGQQLAIAIWAGLTAGLYVLASSDLAKSPKTTEDCSVMVVVKGSEPAIGTRLVKCPK